MAFGKIKVLLLFMIPVSCNAAGNYSCKQHLDDVANKVDIYVQMKNPPVSSYIKEFNRITETNDEGGMAMLSLLAYCSSHKNVTSINASLAKQVAASLGYQSIGDKAPRQKVVDDWYKSTINNCKTSDCVQLANSYKNHATACIQRYDAQACKDAERDRNDFTAMLQKHSQGSPAGDSCLQQTAQQVITHCNANHDCPKDSLIDTIRITQQAMCGYSGLKEDSNSYTPPIHRSRSIDCTAQNTGNGNSSISCFQY